MHTQEIEWKNKNLLSEAILSNEIVLSDKERGVIFRKIIKSLT